MARASRRRQLQIRAIGAVGLLVVAIAGAILICSGTIHLSEERRVVLAGISLLAGIAAVVIHAALS